MKFKKGDQIQMTAGKDKGKTAKIEKVFVKENLITAAGVNVFIKHQKSISGEKGGRIEIAKPIAMGKFELVCPHCHKTTRIGIKVQDAGKVRFCRKCGTEI